MANYDPDRAVRLLTDAEGIAGSIPDEGSKYWAMRGIAGALAAADPDRAERIAKSIPDKSGQVLALRRIAQALTATSSYDDGYERPAELIHW
jgi:hypothetical protein